MAGKPNWRHASRHAWDLARQRQKVIRDLAQAESPGSKARVLAAAKRLRVSVAYIYRLLSAYRQRPRTSTLLLKERGRARGARVLAPEVERLIDRSIKEFYLRQPKSRLIDLIRQLRVECHRAGLAAPNYRTVKRRLDTLDPREVVEGREGVRAARQKFEPVQATHLADYPLELIQIDHTAVDVIVVDEKHRAPIGRPCLTLAIDVATRMIAGFSLSLDPPSTLSVALALTQAVLPKDRWLADREITLEWPVAGLPDTVHFDNAKEFDTHALVQAGQEYDIDILHRPQLAPRYGGHIERLIGTMMGTVHFLPGSTFSNVQEKGSYDSERHAAMTLPELERWIALQILGNYHVTVHSALNLPPRTAWECGLANRPAPLRQPADARQFFLDLLPGKSRLIRRDGIRVFSIHYWDNVLSPLAGRSRRPVLIKYDPRDLSRIYFLDEDGNYWDIPYRELGRPPVTLWEHREVMKQLRAEGRRAVDEKLLFDTIIEQREIVDAAIQSTKQRRKSERRRLATLGPAFDEDPAGTKSVEEDSASLDETTSLPPFKVEEWR